MWFVLPLLAPCFYLTMPKIHRHRLFHRVTATLLMMCTLTMLMISEVGGYISEEVKTVPQMKIDWANERYGINIDTSDNTDTSEITIEKNGESLTGFMDVNGDITINHKVDNGDILVSYPDMKELDIVYGTK